MSTRFHSLEDVQTALQQIREAILHLENAKDGNRLSMAERKQLEAALAYLRDAYTSVM